MDNTFQNFDYIRLNKFIASCGICSRRNADTLITDGRVKVNNKVITDLGYKVKSSDNVYVNNKPISFSNLVYIALNKPKNVVSTTSDPEKRKTVLDLINIPDIKRFFPVGRLDRNTTGILLLTNDGELSYKLTHPSFNISKLYNVTLTKNISTVELKSLLKGVFIDDSLVFFDNISFSTVNDCKKLTVEIHSGKYHIVKRLFELIDFEVKSLDRISFAGITKHGIKRGEWRFLTKSEIAFLKSL